MLVGGGMGVTPSAEKTFPAVAKRMAFVTPERGDRRGHGDRQGAARFRQPRRPQGGAAEVPDRTTGACRRFKAKVEEYYGQPLADPHPDDVHGFDDHIGWHEQGDGRWFYGLNIENGRIHDDDGLRLKTALREICTHAQARHPADAAPEHPVHRPRAGRSTSSSKAILREHGVKLHDEISTVRRWSMACVAWPTCGLSITESERALPGIIDQLEVELAKLGLSSETFTVRMTGCPNGCARPYNCDIGLVGKAAGKYTVFVGGRLLGDRLNFIYKDMVPGGRDRAHARAGVRLLQAATAKTAKRSATSAIARGWTICWPGPSSTRPRRPAAVTSAATLRAKGFARCSPCEPWMRYLLWFAGGYNLLLGLNMVAATRVELQAVRHVPSRT